MSFSYAEVSERDKTNFFWSLTLLLKSCWENNLLEGEWIAHLKIGLAGYSHTLAATLNECRIKSSDINLRAVCAFMPNYRVFMNGELRNIIVKLNYAIY